MNPAKPPRQLVQQIERPDEVGVDAFGVGEHHRREFLHSAPAVILAAAAARTQRIRLTSAVTVLSAEDPVRETLLGPLDIVGPQQLHLPSSSS